MTASQCFDNGCAGCEDCVEYDARRIEAAASQAGVDYGEALGRILGMPQTPAERQEARRARLLMEGMTEVRGIFLPPALHASLKAEARKLLAKHNPKDKK